MTRQKYTRREMLKFASLFVVTTPAITRACRGAEASASASASTSNTPGRVSGQPQAAEVGHAILREGGNAIDAIVAAALTAGVVAPNSCGIGGYGGHMVVSLNDGKKIFAIDFNSTAPSAASDAMFAADADGNVPGRIHEHGWLAAGVAGLQLVLDRFGTRSFREVAAPAIRFARDGFRVSDGFARATKAMAAQLRKDVGSSRWLLKNGEPLVAGDQYRNPALGEMLAALAAENSVKSFYNGAIAQKIAEAFRKNGGLVTTSDLAAYRAREVPCLELSWGEFHLHTAPLTAGGLTLLQALTFLKVLKWMDMAAGPARSHALIEALRIAWKDRLEFLGDPDHAKIPVNRLLSSDYAKTMVEKVRGAVKDQKALAWSTVPRPVTGTIHLNSVDRKGNAVALTLTHGNAFGACVTVDSLGLTLGHGMSRFDPRPGHPNSPGPNKRPLHNMCPTIVTRNGRPVLVIGGTGGRMIPNAIFNVLTEFLTSGATMEQAINAPRCHTEGTLDLRLESRWPANEVEYLKTAGYQIKTGASATVHALALDSSGGPIRAASR
jgi:gamma-glutamyltranspeptidase / glutathione hydrolase